MRTEKILILLTLFILIFLGLLGVISFPKEEQAMKEDNISITTAKNVSIVVVYDNNPYREGLKTAWGFSCLIKGTEKT
ncbi:MBL fold metallo-hydrolase, partial [Archaeoglobales archaeon]